MPLSRKLLHLITTVAAMICSARFQDSDTHERYLMHKKLLASHGVILEYLVQEYAKVCLQKETCTGNESTYNSLRMSEYDCPQCSCRPDCYLNNECCPDVIFGYLKYECVCPMKRIDSETKITSYFMVSSCPEPANDSSSSDDIPVTSLATGITYKTNHFAICNADNEALVSWNAKVSCLKFYGFFLEVEINTFEDLLKHIKNRNCEATYHIADQKAQLPAPCAGVEYIKAKIQNFPKKLVQKCNETGLWVNYDQSIEFACRRLNLPYRIYKNVFCSICNPGLSFKYHKTKPIIRTCLLSDENDVELRNACLRGDETPYHLPFKNLFCRLCNMAYRNFRATNEGIHETWIHVTDVHENTVAKIVGNLYYTSNSNMSDNSSYKEAELNLDMNYNETNYACSVPVVTEESEPHCNNRDTVCTENLVCKQGNRPFYNCTGMFQNYIINRDNNLDVYNENFLYNYVLEMYLCDGSVMENVFCKASVDSKSCTQPNITGKGRRARDDRGLSCFVCKKGNRYDYEKSNFLDGFEILIKINCSNLLEQWSYKDIYSLLETARECSITFIPSGITDLEYLAILTEENSCFDLPFIDQLTCTQTIGSYYFGSYRQLFSLPGNDWEALEYETRKVPTNVTQCTESIRSSENRTTESCREIMCSDGHVLVNDSCICEYETYINALYEITYGFALSDIYGANCGNKMTMNISDLCKGVQQMFRNMIGNKTSFSFHSCTVNSNLECSVDFAVEIAIGSKTEITVLIMIDFTTELTEVERGFVASLSQTVNYDVGKGNVCSLKLIPLSGLTIDTTQPHCRFKSEYVTSASLVLKKTYVNKLVTCPQIDLLEDEFTIENTSDILILTDGEIHVENYIRRDGRVRICVEDLNTYVQIPINLPTHLRIYKLVDNICTILSLFCLSVTFITYCMFSSLQTVPGMNNMSLTFSLFFAQLTLKLGIWQPIESILCPLFGMFIHFFWLATFCSMNVCCFHMHRVFVANTVIQTIFTFKTRVQYLLYTYLSPCAIILLTVGTHLTISKGYSFGYGKTICFLTDTVTVIVVFLCPCVIVFLTNILFFVKTILSLRRTLGNSLVRRSDDRREVFIYLRLWSLLGITWPLIIIDAMSDISIFSYIALSFNTLQGFFIFISFVCNKRVLDMFRKWLTAGVAEPDAEMVSPNNSKSKY